MDVDRLQSSRWIDVFFHSGDPAIEDGYVSNGAEVVFCIYNVAAAEQQIVVSLRIALNRKQTKASHQKAS